MTSETMRYVRIDTTRRPESGRRDDPRMGARMVTLDGEPDPAVVRAVLVGVACDRGVGLNGGRLGSAEGPQRFRDFFWRLPAPADIGQASVLDAGDLMSAGRTTETHGRLAEVVTVLRERFPSAKLVVIGGGHDHAYGEVVGMCDDLRRRVETPRIAVLNVDAHADVRQHNNEPHSGTPFRRLIDEPRAGVAGPSMLAWGLQQGSNAQAHLDWLKAQGAAVVDWQTIDADPSAAARDLLAAMDVFASTHDGLAMSVDLDAFGQAVAPGVSAPAPVGVPAGAVLRAAAHLAGLPCATQMGIYELNPRFDRDGATARLAARLAWSYLTGQV